MKTRPIFIDFEASGLGPHGFPIQVAWGSTHGDVECWLIKPDEEWLVDDGWDPVGESIHGIPREKVEAEGKDAAWICEQMNKSLSGEKVYADGLPFDSMWLNQLFECTESPRQFEIHDAVSMMKNILADKGEMPAGWWDKFKLEAMRKLPDLRWHQADNDVKRLVEMFQICMARP